MLDDSKSYFQQAIIASIISKAYENKGDVVAAAAWRDTAVWLIAKGLEALALCSTS